MKKLYKFFFLLFLAFLVISFIYGTIISWATFHAIAATKSKAVVFGDSSLLSFLEAGLALGLVYGLVLLLFIIFLMNSALNVGRRFTIRNIISVTLWFFAVTTGIHLLHYLFYPTGYMYAYNLLIVPPSYTLPPYLWAPFPLAWLTLVLILVARIKKTG